MYITRKKTVAVALIATGIVILLLSFLLCGDDFIMISIIGIVTFFTISCFLPETKPLKFLSRGSSLTLVGYFTYLALKEMVRNQGAYTIGDDSMPILLPIIMTTLLPIILGVLAYWLSVFTIRGFHVKADYEGFNVRTETEEQNSSHQSTTRSESKF